jgi:hypothetical protein
MNHRCPVCSKDFDSLELFDNHIEQHKDESVLSSAPRSEPKIESEHSVSSEKIHTSNIQKIFDEEKFEKLTESKINKIKNIGESVSRRNFIEQVKEIYKKNPFCYVPNFVESLINGNPVGKLQEDFHFSNHINLQIIIKDILNFKEERYRLAQYPNALELNLKILGWKNKYEELKHNFIFFENELSELFFENVLQAYLILSLMDEYLNRKEIYDKCLELKLNYSFFRFVDDELKIKFNKLLETDLENRVNKILDELISQKIIYFNKADVKKLKCILNFDDIKNFVKKQLIHNNGSLSMIALNSLVDQSFPSLKLIPDLGVFDASVDELKHEKFIRKETRSSRKNDFQIFLSDDFEQLEADLKSIGRTGLMPFMGRKITPETFVSELLELEKGDFNDDDDQVTRLAGLVLAESVALQTPSEEIKEFDFSINLENYRFRPEQIEAMKKLNFQINSKICHIKVMVDKILNLKKYDELKGKLPPNDQGVVITFKKIPVNVKKLLETDSSIQIIDEDGVKIWVSITSRLPARVNSICKISSDPLSKLENKLVRVNSVFYETGFALVSIIPKMNEVTVLARCLEEIPLFESKPSDFELYSKNYLEFLNILSAISIYENLINGFFQNKFIEEPLGTNTELEVKFDYNTVHLDLSTGGKYSTIKCNCMQYAENSLYLCSHLVSALDYMFRKFLFGGESWPDSNNFKNTLDVFVCKNIKIILDKLAATEEKGEIQDNSRLSDFVFGMNKIKSNF